MTSKFIKITLTEEILGTSPNDKEIYDTYIGSKAPDAATREEEIASVGVEEYIERGTTVFPKTDDGIPFMWDYQVKGFFKDACGMLARVVEKDEKGKKKKGLTESARLSSYKKVIDGLIFVFPRKIPYIYNGEIGICQRPLRAQTPQGERIAISSSETLPENTQLVMEIRMLTDDVEKVVKEWLDYGELRGLGQWRNSGKGRFEYEEITEKEYKEFYKEHKLK